jgi:hypothetical protein
MLKFWRNAALRGVAPSSMRFRLFTHLCKSRGLSIFLWVELQFHPHPLNFYFMYLQTKMLYP